MRLKILKLTELEKLQLDFYDGLSKWLEEFAEENGINIWI